MGPLLYFARGGLPPEPFDFPGGKRCIHLGCHAPANRGRPKETAQGEHEGESNDACEVERATASASEVLLHSHAASTGAAIACLVSV